eukprot:5152324-Prymnesium_polylepis.1
MTLERTLRLPHRVRFSGLACLHLVQLASDRRQFLHMGLAWDEEHILHLVGALAFVVGARQHLLWSRRQRDAVEVGEHDKELWRDVGRDAAAGDNLEREQ